MADTHGKILLVDDYRPPVTAANGKQNQEKLEAVIRFVGDCISKGRSNPDLKRVKENFPTGCCVITGEDTDGTQSSLLRMLVLNVSKGDFDGKKLRRFQEDPTIITTHMYHYLKWCGKYADEIISFIQSHFDEERQWYAGSLKELRIIDTAATLMLTARILQSYGSQIGALEPGTEMQQMNQWRNTILEAAVASEKFSKTQNPVCMYLQAFFEMKDRMEAKVVCDIKAYDPTEHIGYAEGDSLWLWASEVYLRVVKYWQKRGGLFPLTQAKITEHLADAGLITVTYETRGDGVKKLYAIKSSLPNRQRLMVLNESLARRYLENENY